MENSNKFVCFDMDTETWYLSEKRLDKFDETLRQFIFNQCHEFIYGIEKKNPLLCGITNHYHLNYLVYSAIEQDLNKYKLFSDRWWKTIQNVQTNKKVLRKLAQVLIQNIQNKYDLSA